MWLLTPLAYANPAVPPPGMLVSVGEHRLHLHCSGRGRPTVILEAGLGGTSLEWSRVQPEVAKRSRVCAYDRAGYGWSQGGPLPRDAQKLAYELRRLLRNADQPGPYVLVGHSFGGFVVRLFSAAFPDDVAGLVLVDAAHERQYRVFFRRGLRTAPRGSAFFLTRPPQAPKQLPDELRPLAQSFAETYRTHRALHGELASFRLSALQVEAIPERSTLPVVIVSRGRSEWRDDGRARGLERAWAELQDELSAHYPRSRHVIAANSGHYIHLEQPRTVIDSVLELVGQHRRRTR